MRLHLLVAVLVLGPAARAMAQPSYYFRSETFSTDLTLAESKEPIHYVALSCPLADGGAGKLVLDPSVPKLDEFGTWVAGGKKLPALTLECTLKLVKKEKNRQLFEVRGPKITGRLFLVADLDSPQGDGRLLVHDKAGEVRYAIKLDETSHRTIPCHPGCFPVDAAVRVPDGTKPIEDIRRGDLVTTIDADGKASSAEVTAVFVTRNRVIEVRVEGGKLVTTETQPVALEKGDFRPAGELKAGDRVWRWVDGERRAAAVLGVAAGDRDVEVVNLVLGDQPVGFIAGDFVVRSKPPAGPVP
jgi:hypothetical protein